jgi:hypothetical protein
MFDHELMSEWLEVARMVNTVSTTLKMPLVSRCAFPG